MISREYLEEFRLLYKNKYNITLSDEELTELATHFLNLMRILIKPKPKLQPDEENKRIYLQGEAK